MRAHAMFDRIWKSGAVAKRRHAYAWMVQKLVLKKDEAHIAMFDKNRCDQLIKSVLEDFPALGDKS